MNKFQDSVKPDSLMISRVVKAPLDAVFRAWSAASHVQRWFAPEGARAEDVIVEFRQGGRFELTMRLPDGAAHTMRCHFTKVIAPVALAFSGTVVEGEQTLFSVDTRLRFTEAEGGTRIEVEQHYEIFDPKALPMVQGAEPGWGSTLAQLGREAEQLARPAEHGRFTLERRFTASPAQVFRAFTDFDAKTRWFFGPDQKILSRQMDVRPGGREHVHGRWPDGTESIFDAVYFDVLPDRRLVYAYEMHFAGAKISVSLATLELFPYGTGTRLTVTEQGSFLDGYEDKGAREHGTAYLLSQVAWSLGEGELATPPSRD